MRGPAGTHRGDKWILLATGRADWEGTFHTSTLSSPSFTPSLPPPPPSPPPSPLSCTQERRATGGSATATDGAWEGGKGYRVQGQCSHSLSSSTLLNGQGLHITTDYKVTPLSCAMQVIAQWLHTWLARFRTTTG